MIQYRRELPELMKRLGLPMIGVEVGVATGGFSKELLQLGIEKLWSVDNWGTIEGVTGDANFPASFHNDNFNKAKKNLNEFGEKSIMLKGLSIEMAKQIPDNTLGLVYHDAGHYYSAVWEDINAYWGKLIVGGIMAFHDFENTNYKVKEAVTDFASANNLEIYLLSEDKMEDAGSFIIKNK